MGYFTYILYSAQLDRYYVGCTQDVSIRLKEHLWKHRGYTSGADDWALRYFGLPAIALLVQGIPN